MATQRFSSKVIFITGGTSGLGLATSKLFISEGAKVFCVDLEERDVLASIGDEQATFHKCDVSDPTSCEAAVEACISYYGRLDVLFNCAGRTGPLASVTQLSIPEFQSVINTNMNATFYLSKYAIPHMSKNGGGAIVNVGSTSGLSGDYGLCAYSASKAGVINLTRAMALDHAKEGIRVNAVCPGYMKTPMSKPFEDNPAWLADMLESIPQGRGCDPIEAGKAVLFLASEDSSYVTGTTLVVDGGIMARSGVPKFTKYLGNLEAAAA